MYEDNFYYEPSEFDQQVEEFKQSLLLKVKDEFKAEMDRLRKENSELQSIKARMNEIEKEHRHEVNRLHMERNEAKKNAMKARLKDLLGGFEVEMWTPEYFNLDSRKCDRCDDNRKIHFKTPLGRDGSESCTCAGKIAVFRPAVNILKKISIRNDWGSIANKWLYYSLKNDGDYDSAELRSSDSALNLFVAGTTTFEEVEANNYRRFHFENYDDCYRFCMWKMQKDAGLLPQAPVSTAIPSEAEADTGFGIR